MRYLIVTMSAAIATLVVAVGIYFWLNLLVANNEKKIKEDAAEIRSYGEIGAEFRSLLKAKINLQSHKEAANRLISQIGFNVDSLADVSFLIPHNVWLTRLNYAKGTHEIRLEGMSTTEAGVAKFLENLISSIKFKQIQQRSIAKDRANPSLFNFAFDCTLGDGA